MYGAIFGDMVGAPYERIGGRKTKDFEMFNERVRCSDDSIMTVAIADALMEAGKDASRDRLKECFVSSMQKWGRRYPRAGFGGMFSFWLKSDNPKPYGSFGNGSAMRVSPIGWFFDSLERTLEVAGWSAEVTHNHAEGIKGAKATAAAIYMARCGGQKKDIKEYIENEFGYYLSMTCDEVRPWYAFDVSCEGTVPYAMIAFLEGQDFEDVIRTAVSLGGDCDTLTCIAGGMAEACYGIPEAFVEECKKRLPDDAEEVVEEFYRRLRGKGI